MNDRKDGLKVVGQMRRSPPVRVMQAFAVLWDELKRAVWDGPLDELIPESDEEVLARRETEVDRALEQFTTTGDYDGTGNFHPTE